MPFVAANWKMNPKPEGWDTAPSPYRQREDIDVVLFPSLADLKECMKPGFTLGAQYALPQEARSYKDLGCTYILCGHSDRRKQGDRDEQVAAQVAAAIDSGLIPILCIGETADERSAGKEKDVINRQLSYVLQNLKPETRNPKLIVAYEPVWAIGTGNTASPEDAQEMHVYIRSLLTAQEADGLRLLYGGSVKKENAAALIAQPDIDGFLVGGASLNPQEFGAIVDIAAANA